MNCQKNKSKKRVKYKGLFDHDDYKRVCDESWWNSKICKIMIKRGEEKWLSLSFISFWEIYRVVWRYKMIDERSEEVES